MRAFIALEPEASFVDEVAELAHRLAQTVDGRFVPRENYHMTLAFLGDINEVEADLAADALESAMGPDALRSQIVLHTSGLGTFGRKDATTLWLGIDLTDDLLGCAERLRTELDGHGLTYDTKPFRAHITLARHAHIPRGQLPVLPFPADSYAVRATLFKSVLDRSGATYKPLVSVSLPSVTASDGPAQPGRDEQGIVL